MTQLSSDELKEFCDAVSDLHVAYMYAQSTGRFGFSEKKQDIIREGTPRFRTLLEPRDAVPENYIDIGWDTWISTWRERAGAFNNSTEVIRTNDLRARLAQIGPAVPVSALQPILFHIMNAWNWSDDEEASLEAHRAKSMLEALIAKHTEGKS